MSDNEMSPSSQGSPHRKRVCVSPKHEVEEPIPLLPNLSLDVQSYMSKINVTVSDYISQQYLVRGSPSYKVLKDKIREYCLSLKPTGMKDDTSCSVLYLVYQSLPELKRTDEADSIIRKMIGKHIRNAKYRAKCKLRECRMSKGERASAIENMSESADSRFVSMLQAEKFNETKDLHHSSLLALAQLPDHDPALLSSIVSLATTQDETMFGSLRHSAFSGLINGLNNITEEGKHSVVTGTPEAKPVVMSSEDSAVKMELDTISPLNSPNKSLSLPSNHEHMPSNHEHMPTNHEHMPSNHEHMPSNHEHMPSNHEHMPSNHEHMSNNERNMLNNQINLLSDTSIPPIKLPHRNYPLTILPQAPRPNTSNNHQTNVLPQTSNSHQTTPSILTQTSSSHQTTPNNPPNHVSSAESILATFSTSPSNSGPRRQTPPPRSSKRTLNEVCDHRLKFIAGTTYACTNCSDYFQRLPAECLQCHLCRKQFTHRHLLQQHKNEVHAVT